MKIKKTVATVLAGAALILELLPFGVILRFANPEGEPWRRSYSYFDLTPYGYGNVTPIMTGILTVLAVVYGILSLVSEKEKTENSAFLLTLAGAVFSVVPFFRGLTYLSPVGAGVTLCLVGACVLRWKKL
ncbi:MAG: hypothetical protein IKC69_02275 [Clostridia bacterium]|nr:hypothetical protein [Clostridia bacterium]